MPDLFERIACAVTGHRYVIERELNDHARKVGCTRCDRHWAMHDLTKTCVPWDRELESLYAPGGILVSLEKLSPEREGA